MNPKDWEKITFEHQLAFERMKDNLEALDRQKNDILRRSEEALSRMHDAIIRFRGIQAEIDSLLVRAHELYFNDTILNRNGKH